MTHVTRDESAEAGYHYRLDLEDGAVEVDAFRLHHQGEILVEVFGRRGSDSQPDSVVVAIPYDQLYSLTQAITRGGVFIQTKKRERLRGQGL